MIPTGERVLWLLLGFVVGWLACRLLSRRRPPPREVVPGRRVETPVATAPPPNASADPLQDPLPPGPSPSRMIDVSAARAAGFNMKHADDLTVIEGIGPKIDELLRANGIESFVQVAQLHVHDLLDILDRGGPSFRLANPANWAQQALLAAENRWAELKQLQKEMIRGEANHDV
jgi:predicted flap endonuclease-1-like 5' DNA nuclease